VFAEFERDILRERVKVASLKHASLASRTVDLLRTSVRRLLSSRVACRLCG
jgi:hypothetical protein